MLLAHFDVVEARREDWTTDPLKLVEKDGYFYARGSGDDKFMAAAFVTNLIRYKQEGFMPDRDLIIVLETDEETGDDGGVGITWLLKHQRSAIDAEFALNEGGSVGATDGSFLRNAGIPTYGHSGLAGDMFDNRAHGKDERVLVKSFYEGCEYLYRLVKALSTSPQ